MWFFQPKNISGIKEQLVMISQPGSQHTLKQADLEGAGFLPARGKHRQVNLRSIELPTASKGPAVNKMKDKSNEAILELTGLTEEGVEEVKD